MMDPEEMALRARIAALEAAIKSAQPGSDPRIILNHARLYELYLNPNQDDQP